MLHLLLDRRPYPDSQTAVREEGELLVDPEFGLLFLHDGETPGGNPINLPELLSAGGNDNLLINGGLDFWDYGGETNLQGYRTANRWTNSGQGVEFLIRRVEDEEHPGKFVIEYQVSGGSAPGDYLYMVYHFARARQYAGQQLTLSFEARSVGGPGEIATENRAYYNTDPVVGQLDELDVARHPLTTEWQRFTKTFTLPASPDIDILDTARYAFRFYLSAGSDFDTHTGGLGLRTQTVQFRRMKLEYGDRATPWQYRTWGEERFLNDYYCERIGTDAGVGTRPNLGMGAFLSQTQFVVVYRFKEAKYQTPSVSSLKPVVADEWQVVTNNTSYNISTLTFSEFSRESVLITATVVGAPAEVVGMAGELQAKDNVYPQILLFADQ